MDLRERRKRKPPATFCWISKEICEAKREEVRKKRMGTTSACTVQRVAYCFHLVDAPGMSRQNMCTRTLAECDDLRRSMLKRITSFDIATACQPMLNTERFDSAKEFESRRYDG